MSMPRCCVCGVSVMQAREAFARVNPTGESPAVWACFSHTDQQKDDVIRVIEEDNERKSAPQ